LQIGIAAALTLVLVAGIATWWQASQAVSRTLITAYFTNSTGIFTGDDVRILGVPVGKIDKIEAQPSRVAITFWVDDRYKVPAAAKAVILSPSLVSARAIQLVPAYTNGPTMPSHAVIPLERTAVPVEWDDFRKQLKKITDTFEPTQPGGVSPLGSLINTAADNLRGQGENIHDAIVKLSQAFSALGDHRDDIFGTIRNLSILVSALQGSTDLMRALNENFAAVTALLSDSPDEVGKAVADINSAVADVKEFIDENREPIGTATGHLASVTTTLQQSVGDIKQLLHIFPTELSSFVNIYHPAQAAVAGVAPINNFSNPIQFICSAVQAASRLGAEQAAKLCVQYLAPIVKNRQYNFPPIGQNLFDSAAARPNEVTYSEDWMRPDYVPPPGPGGAAPGPGGQPPAADPGENAVLPAEQQPASAGNLTDLMMPHGSGS
jgi:phospholipid/cholesterol/gamma-HCH transport system substrate-binding protein